MDLLYVPTLTYDHKLWVVTQRLRSWTQTSFLLRERVRSSDIKREGRVLNLSADSWSGCEEGCHVDLTNPNHIQLLEELWRA